MPPLNPYDADLDAIGQIARSADRLAVVRHLRQHPGTYFGAIQKETGIPVGSLGKHLRELEAQGVIDGDLPSEERHGRYVRYTLNLERIGALIDHLSQELRS